MAYNNCRNKGIVTRGKLSSKQVQECKTASLFYGKKVEGIASDVVMGGN